MKKNIMLIILLGGTLIYFSCNSVNMEKSDMSIFHFESDIDDDVINGQNLEYFFNGDKKIKKYSIASSDSLIKELQQIKVKANKSTSLKEYSLGFGLYDYALVFKKDTFYSSSDLKSWRYKNKVILYKSPFLEKEIKTNKL